MKTTYLGCLLTALVFLAACKPQEAAKPADTAPPQSATNPVDATAVVDNTASVAADPAALDSKAIAGRFGDGESVLELRADGTYVQTLNAGGDAMSSDGSWTASGQDLLLDPNSKSAEDVRLTVASNDELHMENGKHVFRRIAGQ